MVRLRILDTTTIPKSGMEMTPEGYLICHGVALARTGEQIYYAHEIPGVPARGGRITAVRDEDEVFHPDAIESFRGKHFTDDHPDVDVGPENWRDLMKGVVMNPRRGEGANADKLLGDIIVYDPATIAKIKSGKREISNGYDADYEVVEPGRARQVNIRGNHVSLVDEGRCGPACAIRDKDSIMALNTAPKLSWKDRLFKVLRTDDAAEREKLLKDMEGEDPDEHHEGDGHHITLNVGIPTTEEPKDIALAKSTEDEEGPTEEPVSESTDMDEDKVNELIASALSPVMEQLRAIAEAVTAQNAKVEEVAEAVDDMSDPEDMATQDAVARAAILAPSLTRLSTDAKPGSKSHRDAMSNFKRDALKGALTTDAGRHVVGSILGHVQPHRITAMTPAEVNVAFRAASQIMLDHNAAQAVQTLTSATSGYVRDDNGAKRPMTPADLQARANKFYGRA